MDMIQKLNLDKKIKEQGIEEKIQKTLEKGYSLDIITEILGVSIEEVEKVKKKM